MISKEKINLITYVLLLILLLNIVSLYGQIQSNKDYCNKKTFCNDCSYNIIKEKCICCGIIYSSSNNTIINFTKVVLNIDNKK